MNVPLKGWSIQTLKPIMISILKMKFCNQGVDWYFASDFWFWWICLTSSFTLGSWPELPPSDWHRWLLSDIVVFFQSMNEWVFLWYNIFILLKKRDNAYLVCITCVSTVHDESLMYFIICINYIYILIASSVVLIFAGVSLLVRRWFVLMWLSRDKRNLQKC